MARPHVHCYTYFPDHDFDHCLKNDRVLGPDDVIEIGGKTYHALVEFGPDMCLRVKTDHRGAQVATAAPNDIVDDSLIETLTGSVSS